MKIEELRQEIETKKVEARGLLEIDLEKAEQLTQEVRDLQNKLDLALELEEQEKRDLENQKNNNEKGGNEKMEKINEMRSAVKYMLGKEMEKEERATVKTIDNQAVLPKQFINELELIEKGYGSLEEYCHVIPVTKNEGTKPVFEPNDEEFSEVAEGDVIGETGLKTTDISFKCSKVGTITSLSSEVVEDAEVDVEYLAKEQFTVKDVTTKNVRICNIIKEACKDNKIDGTSYKDINKVIDTSIPAVKNGLKTFTNELGYSYLKNLEDKQGRNLNLITELNGKYYFNGKELVVTDSTYLTSGEDGKLDFYVLNSKEVIKFFKRKGITVAKSSEAGFDDDTVKLRILGRFGVTKGTIRGAKHVQVAIA